MKGKFADFFIIKGVGTGNFKGMCIYGANYLSKNMGYNYKQILKHYFPDSIIKDEN
jgi:peptidoglycan hydrolase-like amidase